MENLGLFGGFEYSSLPKQKYNNISIQNFDVMLDSKLYFNTFQNKKQLLDTDLDCINETRQDKKTRKNYKKYHKNTKKYKK